MKNKLPYLTPILFIFAFLLVGHFKTVLATNAAITVSFSNGGDAPANVSLTIRDQFNNFVYGNSSLYVGPFSTAYDSTTDIPDAGPYTVTWDPSKAYGPDPRDQTCQDPVSYIPPSFYDELGDTQTYNGSYNFQCWIPPQGPPPPGAFNLVDDTTSCVGGGSSAARVDFYWGQSSNATSYDIYYGINGGALQLQTNVTPGSTTTWGSSNFSSNVTVQWRILAKNSGGQTWSNQTWGPFTTGAPGPCPPPSGSPPVVNLSANPSSVSSGGSSTLSWSASNSPSSCSVWGGWGGTRGASGSENTGALFSTTTYNMQCSNSWGSSNVATATVTVSGGGGGTNDFTLTGNGASGSTTVASGTNVNMIWTHTAGSGPRYSCWASSSPAPTLPSWDTGGTGIPSSGVLENNGGGHGVSTTSTKTLTMTCNYSSGSPSQVSKNFTINISGGGGGAGPFTLTVTRQGTAVGTGSVSSSPAGINCGSDCSESYGNGTVVGLVAFANGSTFAGWGGACSGTGSCSVTMNANQTVTATFNSAAQPSCSWSPANISVGQSSTISQFNAAGTAGGPPTPAGWSGNYPTYTFPSAGTYTWTMTQNSQPVASCSVVVTGASTPAPVLSNGCNLLNISWSSLSTASGNQYYIHMSLDSGFVNNMYWKSVTAAAGSTSGSTTAPSGFLGGSSANQNQALNLVNGQQYWVRVIGSSTSPTNGPWTYNTTCGGPTNLTATPAACPTTNSVTFSWTGSASNWSIDIDNDGNYANGWLSTKTGINGTSTTGPTGFNNSLAFAQGTTYTWRIWTGTVHVVGSNFTMPTCAASVPTPAIDSISCSPAAQVNNNWGMFRVTWNGNPPASWSYFVQIYSTATGGSPIMQTPNSSTYSGNYFPGGSMTGGPLNAGTTYYVGLATSSAAATNGRASVNIPYCPNPTSMTASVPGCANGPYTATLSWNGASGNWWVDLSGDNWASWANKNVNGNSTTAPDGFNVSFTLNPGQNYHWRIWNGTHYYPTNGGTSAPGTPFNVPRCGPSNLQVSNLPACATSAGYNPTFSWTGTSAGWWLNLDTNTDWDNENNGVAEGDAAKPLSGTSTDGSGLGTFLPGVTYRWNIWYGNGTGSAATFIVPTSVEVTNAQLINGSFSPGAGYSFSVPGCIDVKARFNNTTGGFTVHGPSHTFAPGENISLTVNVSNVNSGTPAAFAVGLWPGKTTDSAFPSCTNGGGGSGSVPNGNMPPLQTINSLPPSTTQALTFNFAAPTTAGSYVARAYAMPGCSHADIDYANNATNTGAAVGGEYVGSFGYTVDVDGWFQTQNGDVGAANGSVTTEKAPPAGANIVNGNASIKPLLVVSGGATAGTGLPMSNYVSGTTFTSYNKNLMPAGTYTYLAERFLNKSTTTNRGTCSQLFSGVNKCTAPGGTWSLAGALPAGINGVMFIEGNLRVNGELTIPGANDSMVYVVSGNIQIDTNVSRADGIFIAGGQFTDTDTATGISGPQLAVNGAVYAGDVALARVLGGPLCGALCNNDANPAEVFTFLPKYVINVSNLLGTPAITWQEAAPQ